MRARAWSPFTRLSLIPIAAATCLAGCGGGKNEDVASQPPAAAAPAAAQPAAAAAPDGRQLFQRCAVCHQPTGAGVPGSFPPLAGSEWATATNVALPIRVVLHGLQGAITVKGGKFNGAMPAYGTMQPMNDAEVAAVLTYVRSAWGNTAGAVSADDVAKERAATASQATPWNPAQLAPLLKAR